MKKKILVIINTKFNLSRRKEFLLLFNDSFEIHVLCPQDNSNAEVLNFEYHYSKYLDGNSSSITNDLRFIGELYKIKHKLKPSIILPFTIKPIIYSSLVFRNYYILATLTGLGYVFERNNLSTYVAKKLLKLSNLYINELVTQNKEDKIKLESFLKRKINLVSGSGLDFNNFIKPKINSNFNKNILIVGRLIKAKGISRLIDNFFQFNEVLETYGLTLTIIGDYEKDNPDSICSNDYNFIKDNKNIIYVPHTKRIDSYYMKSDFVLTLSNREGLNRVNIEGMYFGLGVITLLNPGCHEMLVDSQINLKLHDLNFKKICKFFDKFYNLSNFDLTTLREKNSIHIINNYSSEIVYKQYKKILKI